MAARALEPRGRRLDAVEVVEDPHHVGRPVLPEHLLAFGPLQAEEGRAQVCRLQDCETVCRPEFGQRRVALQRRERVASPMAVRE
jgi:hypothetical protein